MLLSLNVNSGGQDNFASVMRHPVLCQTLHVMPDQISFLINHESLQLCILFSLTFVIHAESECITYI